MLQRRRTEETDLASIKARTHKQPAAINRQIKFRKSDITKTIIAIIIGDIFFRIFYSSSYSVLDLGILIAFVRFSVQETKHFNYHFL